MQVALRAAQIDLEVDEPAQPVADRRDAAVEHRRVGDDDDVGGELGFVVADEVVEVRGADFLLALEDDLHVHRQPAVLLQVRLDRLEVHEDLALVVGRAARVELAVANRRLERRGFPQTRADRPAARRSGRRTGSSARPPRPASRRRRPGGLASRSAGRSAVRCGSISARVHSAHARTSSACCGSALMLGMARYVFSSST